MIRRIVLRGLHLAGVLVALAGGAACNRDNVQVSDDKAAPSGESRVSDVQLSEAQIRAAGITVGEVSERDLAVPVEASAQIEAPPDRVARVGSRVSGRVVRVLAGIGDHVRTGSTVAVVDSPDLARAKADYLGTLAGAKLARANADREKALFDRRISAEREWRQAEADAVRAESEKEAAENKLHSLGVPDDELASLQSEGHFKSTVNLTAPLAGVVVDRAASIGQAVEPADMLFTIMDLREVWIVMDVFEKDLRLVAEGQRAEVRVAAYPDRKFEGRVANVGVVLEPQTRAAKVRVVLSNANLLLKPGMFAEVQLRATVGSDDRGLFVPAGAVQRDGADNIVFIARDSGRFEVRRISTGLVTREWVQVVQGLAKGDRIAISGAFTLKSERRKGELGESDEH